MKSRSLKNRLKKAPLSFSRLIFKYFGQDNADIIYDLNNICDAPIDK